MVKVWKSNKKIHVDDLQQIEKAMILIIELLDHEKIGYKIGIKAVKELICRLIAAMGTPTERVETLQEIHDRVQELLNEEEFIKEVLNKK